jgi:hypothetical protein
VIPGPSATSAENRPHHTPDAQRAEILAPISFFCRLLVANVVNIPAGTFITDARAAKRLRCWSAKALAATRPTGGD